MPTVAGPNQLDNRHLAVSSLSRNDSLKSERSDKRVSFNNDVGIKHIPRGVNKPPVNHSSTLPNTKQSKSDEWSGCHPVTLQPNNLTAKELEQEAAHLVDIVDSINCEASPLPKKKQQHKDFTSRSLDRSQKRINLNRNGQNPNYNRITNPIIKHLKADVNRRDNRRKDPYSDSDSDRYRAQRHKSVPNLLAASQSGKVSNPSQFRNGFDNSVNYSSVDNLLEEKTNNIVQAVNQSRGLHSSHHSADNLLDVDQDRSNLVGYKSLGHIPHYTDSDSTDLSSHYKRPKVNQLIHKLSRSPKRDYRNTNDLSSDRESSSPSRSVVAPSRKHRHNNNKPFSYTNSNPSASLTVREKSPSRDADPDSMYAQVNKHGIRQRLSMDSDYSAKIIITEDKPRNSYEGDDEAYETFNVQNNSLKSNRYGDYGLNLSRDDLNYKNNAMNNNMNMSSVAVQTDTVSKALNKERHKKGRAPQPPTENVYANYRPSRKDVGSELPSADLVRQINHGFGRFDRSPSPPPRKFLNPANSRPHIPLLSDTSDSEPEYRYRSDPLAKIRNQVLMGERLQEEHDAEEWEEREMERYQKNKHLSSNTNDMRPLTIDEVEDLSVEFDQHGDRKLVLSNKSADKRSSSLQTSRHHTETRESFNDRAYSEERSRPTKPLKEKIPSNRDSNHQMTLERNKKNNLEREKVVIQEKKALEIEKENDKKKSKDTLKSKNKDKKGKDTIKDKKKKRIKIKFFYDPRPQDKAAEDPLKRFTEYKGDERKETPEKTKTPKAPRSKSYESRSQSRERDHVDEISINPRYGRDSSRERTLPKPERSTRKPIGRSTDRLYCGRKDSGNDHSSHDESNDDRRRIRSTDSYDRRNRYDGKTEYNTISRDERRTKLSYDRDANFDKREPRQNYNSSDDYDRDHRAYKPERNGRYDPRYDDYNDSADNEAMKRSTFLERREAYERRDSNNVTRRDSFSPRKEVSVDRVDSIIRRSSYNDEYSRKRNGYHNSSPSDESPTREEKYQSGPDDDKQERVMRQRKKFLSALMTDGRAKSSNVPSPNKPSTTTTTTPQPSSTQHPRDRFTHSKENGSDPPPPPSVTSSTNKPPVATAAAASSKKSIKSKKKKKKKSWPWAFLGLRGNKQKKGPPSSRGGSEVGSNLGSSSGGRKRNIQVLKNSRPNSRASSHRSSSRPLRPSVRASKIRKDAGDSSRVWSSRVHDQRETRNWESATLQHPKNSNQLRDREISHDSYNRPSSRQNRNTRRISEGSSGSSAGPRPGRTPSFKQRYFGDSHNEPVRPSKTGPGDYRSLPNRTVRTGTAKRGARIAGGGGGGSAGSSLQSSESENDSHQGSRASHVSTGSNRSVYLHATAVADIPVQKEESEKPGVQRQTRKVTRSFSLAAPWKPKHGREARNYDYDNRDGKHAAKPPRPPRKTSDQVGRSQTLTNKDSKLSGWLKKRKNKDGKGI